MMKIDIFDELIDIQKVQFEKIKREWGYSTVQLKKYMNMYDNDYRRGYAEEMTGINVNRLLPYTNSVNRMLYGEYGIRRLSLAIEAKALIMFVNGDFDDQLRYGKYIGECLHLFLRINSIKTQTLTYKRFCDIVNSKYAKIVNAYNDANEWQKEIDYLFGQCEKYKPKRKQTLYHYKLEDFESIRDCDNWKEAYELWCNNVFPSLLDNYKKKVLNDYKHKLQIEGLETGHKLSAETYSLLMSQLKKDLELVKINKPNNVYYFKKLVLRTKEKSNNI